MSDVMETIVQMHREGCGWDVIAGAVGLSRYAAQGRFYRWRKQQEEGEEHTPASRVPKSDIFSDAGIDPEVVFHDKREQEEVDWRELVKLAEENRSMQRRLDDSQEYAKVEVKTREPIVVGLTGDWHLGDGGTDHVAWMHLMERVMNTPFVKIIDLGDSYQNMRRFKVLSAVLNQALPPKLQARMFKGIVDELTGKEKLLARIDGNHDAEFDARLFGEELQAYLLANLRAPRFPNRGVLDLKVGTQEYSMLLFHKSRFRSILNATHGAKREYDFDYPAEIVAGAHDHTPAAQTIFPNLRAAELQKGFGGETFLFKIGTFQRHSSYGYRYFHNGGVPIFWWVVLDARRHRKAYFDKLEDAVEFRKVWVESQSS